MRFLVFIFSCVLVLIIIFRFLGLVGVGSFGKLVGRGWKIVWVLVLLLMGLLYFVLEVIEFIVGSFSRDG